MPDSGGRGTAGPAAGGLLPSAPGVAGLMLVLALLIGVFSLVADTFFSPLTLRTVANQLPPLVVVSVGMTLVLVAAGIDLAVGSVLALAAAALGVAMVDLGLPAAAGALAAVATGAAAGLANGIVTVRFRLPSFIVTLGMLEIARGGAYLLTRSQTKYIGSEVGALAQPLPVLGLSPAFLAAVATVILAQLVLERTVWGRQLVAIGTNREAVRLAGVDPRPAEIGVFAASGLLAGVAGLFQVAHLESADPNAGTGLELQAIAAVVIGGTSLQGGRGSVINSFFGVLIIAVLQAGLAQIGATEPAKRVVTGAVIVVAVVLDAWRRGLPGGRLGALRARWSARRGRSGTA